MKTGKFKTFLHQLQIGCVFFGTLVGAGFASGKETWTYFAGFGVVGYISIFIACCLFFVCGALFLNFGKKFAISSVQDMNNIMFKKFAVIGEIVIVFCNLILLASMFAGANSLFNLIIFSTSFRIASVITAIIALLVVWFGFGGLTKANIVVVPLILIVLSVCLSFDVKHPETYTVISDFGILNVLKCFVYCVLFVSSNMFFSGFVFARLGKDYTKTEILGGSFIGAFLLFISLFLMSVVLFLNPDCYKSDMPLVSIASTLSKTFSIFTLIVVWVGLITTAIALLYTISNWLKTYVNSMFISSIITTAAAMIFSGIGFSSFIVYVYPVLGFIGIFYIIIVARLCLKKDNKFIKNQSLKNENKIIKTINNKT